MTEPPKKIAWVLGAGFSQPLGAPLLVNFFSDESLTEVRGFYPNSKYPLLHHFTVDVAHSLYWWGRGDKGERKVLSAPPVRNLWCDAEQFLSYLDRAAAEDENSHRATYLLNQAKMMRSLSPPGETFTLRDVLAAARRFLAAECLVFLEGSDPKAEHWKPFLRWGGELVQKQDAILCFNYDMTPEHIADHLRSLGNELASYRTEMPITESSENTGPGMAPLLKLHGSVNWALDKKSKVQEQDDANHALLAEDDKLVLGTPGPGKQQITQSLELLWIKAEQALFEADAVVFVGYRFPPTDTEACRRLMNALKENIKPYVAAHIVLGPEVGKPEVRRLQEMLKTVFDSAGRHKNPAMAHHYNVLPQPMYSQDFLLLSNRDRILWPWV